MLSKPALTPEQDIAVCEMVKAGASWHQIGLKFSVKPDVCRSAMRRVCGTSRVTDLRSNMNRTLSPEQDQQVCELLRQRKSLEAVAEIMGTNPWCVENAFWRVYGHRRIAEVRGDLRKAEIADVGTAEYEARVTLEKMRWPDGAKCPKCGATARRVGGGMGARGSHKCDVCKWWFTVFSGTALHNTKSSRVGVLYLLRRVADTGKPPSFKELSRITGLSHVTVASTVSRIRLCVASKVRGAGLDSLRERYSWDELRSDIGKLAKEYSSDGTVVEARLHGLCNAIFNGAVVGREYAVRKGREEGKSFGRFKNVPITYRGKTMTTTEWAMEIGVDYPTLLYRLNSGWPIGEALKHTTGKRRAKSIRLGDGKARIVKAMLASGRSMMGVARCYGLGHSTVKGIRQGTLYRVVDGAPLLPILDNAFLPKEDDTRFTGEGNSSSKFTELDIVYMMCCARRGVSQEKTAKRLGTFQATVSAILRGKTWNLVTGMPRIRKSRAKVSLFSTDPQEGREG